MKKQETSKKKRLLSKKYIERHLSDLEFVEIKTERQTPARKRRTNLHIRICKKCREDLRSFDEEWAKSAKEFPDSEGVSDDMDRNWGR